MTRAQVDNLLSFSHLLGLDYRASWNDARSLTIFTSDATGSSPPTIGDMYVSVKAQGNLRNAQGSSAPLDRSFPDVRWGQEESSCALSY